MTPRKSQKVRAKARVIAPKFLVIRGYSKVEIVLRQSEPLGGVPTFHLVFNSAYTSLVADDAEKMATWLTDWAAWSRRKAESPRTEKKRGGR